MKSFIILTSLLLSTLATANEGVKKATITEPKYPDFHNNRLLYNNHFEDLALTVARPHDGVGVCKLLGYREYIPRSIRFSNSRERAIIIDPYGNISKMRSDRQRITRIECSNYIGINSKVAALHLEQLPIYPNTNLPVIFKDYGAADGVCKVKGYDNALKGATIFSGEKQRVLVVNQKGEPNEITAPHRYHQVIQDIICIKGNNDNHFSPAPVTQVFHPTYSLRNYAIHHMAHTEDGICRYLGFPEGSLGLGAVISQPPLYTSTKGFIFHNSGEPNRRTNHVFPKNTVVTEIACLGEAL